MDLRLGNQVVYLPGKVRAALYDLHRRRLVRVPQLVGEWIQDAGAVILPPWALEAPVIKDLIERQFIVQEKTAHKFKRVPFNTKSAPKVPPLHSVAIEMGSAWKQQLSWAASAQDAGARVVSIFVGDLNKQAVFQQVAPVLLNTRSAVYRAVEILDGAPDDWREGDIYDAHGQLVAKRRRVSGVRSFQSKLRVDETHFSMLSQLSELTGHVFVGKDLAAVPHWAEKHVQYGNIADITVAELLSSSPFESVRANSKDRRKICADCELRYACVHPFSDRSDPSDISSAPVNCTYDPLSEDSQVDLFS